jgi:hypothetical protein
MNTTTCVLSIEEVVFLQAVQDETIRRKVIEILMGGKENEN